MVDVLLYSHFLLNRRHKLRSTQVYGVYILKFHCWKVVVGRSTTMPLAYANMSSNYNGQWSSDGLIV